MSGEMIRAIVTDLDRTVMRLDKTMSGYSRDVLRRCRERGIHVLAASARPERTIREFGVFDEFEALTTLNGARVMLPGGAVVNGITKDTGRAVISRLVKIPGAVISVEMSGGIYSSAPIPEWNSAVFYRFPEIPEGELYKILISGVTRDDMEKALTEDTYFTAIEGGRLYQIMSRAATKWEGVKLMLAAVGVSPEECAYFGDDWDDIECVERCGLGVAVENAIPEVKAVANVTVGHCDDDGAAEYIEKEIIC